MEIDIEIPKPTTEEILNALIDATERDPKHGYLTYGEYGHK